MKKTLKSFLVLGLAFIFALNVQAQDEEAAESPWSAGLDIYSSYIWRGAKFGDGVAFQPSVSFTSGNFSAGAWGSVTTSTNEGYEMDLFAGYSFGAISLNVTDYYFGGDWTDFKLSHSIEPALALSLGDFSLTAAYMFLAGSDDDPSTAEDESVDFGENGDMYFEAGYSFGSVSVGLGAGDGQYTDDGDFNICNINVGTSKDIKVSDTWTLPVSGAVILNPSTGGFFITAGISF